MKRLGLSPYALAIGAAAALLAGCGGSQPPIGPPGATVQSRAVGGVPRWCGVGKCASCFSREAGNVWGGLTLRRRRRLRRHE